MHRYYNIGLGFVLSALVGLFPHGGAQAEPVNVLYGFKGVRVGDGANPDPALVIGDDGSLMARPPPAAPSLWAPCSG
jgi:hypothetical protein